MKHSQPFQIQITATRLHSLWEKSAGLLHSQVSTPVYFKTRFGIHTFGMKYPIDVLILNNDMRVAKIAQNLQPHSIFLWNPMHHHVIELEAGYVAAHSIVLGTGVTLTDKEK